MTTCRIEVAVTKSRTLRGDLELPPRADWPAPVVLFCHGFKGFKDWGPWPWIARALAERGLAVLRFNFSLCGVGTAADRHDEPEKFAINTYGAELEDLAMLVAERARWGAPAGALSSLLGIAGHSRGGMVALLFAADREEIRAVATLGAPADSDRYDAATKSEWQRAGRLPVVNQRTGQVLYMNSSILVDYEMHRARYDVQAALRRRRIPTLVMHGAEDEAIPVADASRIFDGITHDKKKLVVIPRTGHTFGAAHPFAGKNAHLEAIVAECAAWFREYLAA